MNFPPQTPGNLKVTPDPAGNALTISWDQNAGEDITEYLLYYSKIVEDDWQFLSVINTISPHSNSFYHADLVDGEIYYYKLQANNSYGQLSPFSDIVSGIPSDTTPPPIPSGLKVISLSHDKLSITWDENTDDTEEYRLFRSKNPKPVGWGQPIGYIYKGTNNFTDYNLDERTTYYYVMKVYDEVPNVSEMLLEACHEYNDFYWIRAHLNYFSKNTVLDCLKKAGFGDVEVRFQQRYGLVNLCNWLSAGKPQIEKPVFEINKEYKPIEDNYRNFLEEQGKSDALIAIARL